MYRKKYSISSNQTAAGRQHELHDFVFAVDARM